MRRKSVCRDWEMSERSRSLGFCFVVCIASEKRSHINLFKVDRTRRTKCAPRERTRAKVGRVITSLCSIAGDVWLTRVA